MNNIATTAKSVNLTLPPLIKGTIGAIITILFGSLMLATVYCFTALPDTTMHALQLPLLALAAFIGAFIAAKTAGRKGFMHGIRQAIVLLVLLLLFTLFGGSFSLIALILKGSIILAAAAMGGILGVF